MIPSPVREVWVAFGTIRWNGEPCTVYAASRDAALLLFWEQACEGMSFDGIQRFTPAGEPEVVQ